MRPHIVYGRGLWYCRRADQDHLSATCHASPSEALRLWLMVYQA